MTELQHTTPGVHSQLPLGFLTFIYTEIRSVNIWCTWLSIRKTENFHMFLYIFEAETATPSHLSLGGKAT